MICSLINEQSSVPEIIVREQLNQAVKNT